MCTKPQIAAQLIKEKGRIEKSLKNPVKPYPLKRNRIQGDPHTSSPGKSSAFLLHQPSSSLMVYIAHDKTKYVQPKATKRKREEKGQLQRNLPANLQRSLVQQ